MGSTVKVPARVAWKRYWMVRVMLVRPPDICIELEEPLPRYTEKAVRSGSSGSRSTCCAPETSRLTTNCCPTPTWPLLR